MLSPQAVAEPPLAQRLRRLSTSAVSIWNVDRRVSIGIPQQEAFLVLKYHDYPRRIQLRWFPARDNGSTSNVVDNRMSVVHRLKEHPPKILGVLALTPPLAAEPYCARLRWAQSSLPPAQVVLVQLQVAARQPKKRDQPSASRSHH